MGYNIIKERQVIKMRKPRLNENTMTIPTIHSPSPKYVSSQEIKIPSDTFTDKLKAATSISYSMNRRSATH